MRGYGRKAGRDGRSEEEMGQLLRYLEIGLKNAKAEGDARY